MKESELINSLRELRDTDEANVQLDIYRDNGQIIMQIFSQKDMLNWSESIEIIDANGSVVELLFNTNKTDNTDNFRRFQDLEKCEDWRFRESEIGKSFFLGVGSKINLNDFHGIVIGLIHSVYNIDKHYYFTLNAY